MRTQTIDVWVNGASIERKRALVCLAVMLIVPCPGRAISGGELLVNPSFEKGTDGWHTDVGAPRLRCDVAAGGHTGVAALRVSDRVQLTDGPAQAVTGRLGSGGTGKRYAVSLWIKLDKPASVRAMLDLSDNAGIRRVIMAERVVRTTGTWVRVVGNCVVAWSDSLKEARLAFDVGQLGERPAPDYLLDDVSFAPDTDGDLLTDGEEVRLGTDPAKLDSDNDGLPDGWEVEHRLKPLDSDDRADLDDDGADNRQEYWAATDPNDAGQYPGKPADPKASPAVRDVLRYLALLPSHAEHRVVVGQHLTQAEEEYESQVVKLARDTGKWPALLCLQYEGLDKPLNVDEVTPLAFNYWNAGGLVLIKFACWNPWTGRRQNDRVKRGAFDPVDITGLIDPARSASPERVPANQKAHETFVGWLDRVADGLRQLQDKGVVVMWRPCSEMNGAWFWWGRRSRDEYIALWRFMFKYLTETKELHNLIWVYESDSSAHEMLASDWYYPGNDVVDVTGHNLYNDTWVLPFDAELVYRDYPKVYAIPQAGSQVVRDGSWDNMTYLQGIRSRLPRCSLFAAWNTFRGAPTQQKKVKTIGPNQVLVICGIVDNKNAHELMHDPWIVSRDLLPSRKP